MCRPIALSYVTERLFRHFTSRTYLRLVISFDSLPCRPANSIWSMLEISSLIRFEKGASSSITGRIVLFSLIAYSTSTATFNDAFEFTEDTKIKAREFSIASTITSLKLLPL